MSSEILGTSETARSAASPALVSLRQEIARILARAGASFARQNEYLRDESYASHEAGRFSLGRSCMLDRGLGGGLKPGTLTEILGARPGDAAAAAGFLLALATRLARRAAKAPIVWIFEDFAAREQGMPYGPGLALHGLDPGRLLLVSAPGAQQALWAMEEALKCRGPAVVIGELWSPKPYDLVASRRLLLAAQKHGTPALLFLAGAPGAASTLSSGADQRFEIRAHPSLTVASAGSLPLPGKACWSVRLAKARAAGLGIDRDRFHPLLWDHDEAQFCDALSLDLASDTFDRSDQTAQARGA
jgi:protein ImuA